MNKLFTKIAAAFVGMAMAIGVGVAVASNREAARVEAAGETTAVLAPRSVTSVADKTDDQDNTWSMASDAEGFTSNTSYVHAGSGSKNVSYLRFTTSAYNSFTISSIELYGAAAASSGATLKIYVGDELKAESDVLGNTASSGGTKLEWKNNDDSSGDIRVEVSRESKTKKALYFNQAIVKYTSGDSSKTSTTTTISAAGDKTTLDISKTPKDSVVLTPTIAHTGGTISSSVSWESSNTAVATVSPSTGTTATVTAVAKGKTIITATYDGDDTYDSSYGTIEITVENPNEKTYSLKFGDGIVSSTNWTSSYGAHNGYTKEEAGIGTLTFNFAAASKQGSNITDYPVGKDGEVEMILSSTNYYIKDVTFNGLQWGTKEQTMTINYSTDEGDTYAATDATSSTFTVSKSNLAVGTNGIKITFSNSSNQIGHKNFEVLFAEKPVLSSIETSGQKTNFAYGDQFAYGGTLTAHYTAGKADATVTPKGFKFGGSNINPENEGTDISLGEILTDATHNGKYIYVSYAEGGITKWTDGYQITVGAAPSYYMTLTVSTDTGTNYGYKGGIVEVDVTSSSLAGNINWTVSSGTVSDASYDNTSYFATIESVGTLTIVATDTGDNTNTQSVSITVIESLNAVNAPNVTNHSSSLTFNNKYDEGGELVNGETSSIWTVTSNGTESTFDETNGIHYGTNSAQVQYVQLATSSVATGENDTIKSIVVNTQDRATNKGALTVTVGGVSFKHEGNTSVTVTGVAADYTFTGNGTGEIVVKVDRESNATKAIYVKSVTVNYVTASGASNIANAINMHLAQKAVIDYAKDFNDDLEAICVAYGSTNVTNLTGTWNDLAGQYDDWFNNGDKDLTPAEIVHAKALFANAESVNREKVVTADELQHMLAKYDWIVQHYHLTDFLSNDPGTNRSAVPQANSRILLNSISSNSQAAVIVVIISMVSITAIGGYFFIRKRKEQ